MLARNRQFVAYNQSTDQRETPACVNIMVLATTKWSTHFIMRSDVEKSWAEMQPALHVLSRVSSSHLLCRMAATMTKQTESFAAALKRHALRYSMLIVMVNRCALAVLNESHDRQKLLVVGPQVQVELLRLRLIWCLRQRHSQERVQVHTPSSSRAASVGRTTVTVAQTHCIS